MKRKYVIFVMLALCSALVYPQSESDFQVELNEAGDGVVIQKYNGNLTQIVIPKTIQEMPVLELAENIFKDFRGRGVFTDIKLPEGLIKMGNQAFYGQKKLTTITFPASLKYIGAEAFSDSGLTKIVIPETVSEIGERAFFMTPLSDVTLPKNMKIIPDSLFLHCKGLTSVTFPEGLEEIGAESFRGTGLTKIVLPKSITKISEDAFTNCSKLTEVVFPENADNILFAAGKRDGIQAVFKDCPALSLATQANIRRIAGYVKKNE
jgi:hypothetical protein